MLRAFPKVFIACVLALTAALAFAQGANPKANVKHPSAFAISRPLSELPIDSTSNEGREEHRPMPVPLIFRAGDPPTQDPVSQKEIGPSVAATKGIDFDGIGANGWAPSDVNFAIGPNHIVQTVNVQVAVYNKSGALLAGPTNLFTLFAPLGGDCAAGSSDPIANYDRLADRWVVSDIGINTTFSECVAVSKTNDPTGAYTLYAYSFSTSLNDYPKLSVWPTATNSAYLATYNMFTPTGFGGAAICGMDRAKMIAGDASAAQICQLTPNNEGSYLPSDLDGPTPPIDGTPGLFLSWHSSKPGQLYLRKLTLNFAAGTGSLAGPTVIAVANSQPACGNGGTCVPQKGTTQKLDTLGDRLMYRMAYRKFPDHERVLVNHAIGSLGTVGVRWYEILDPSGAVTVNQQSSFLPDLTYRWMASAAMDKVNDIALGYSASSPTINPAIRFTGRLPGDPLGTLETETSILEGTGSQTSGLSRWGDYTALQVDPNDDCTFWYTNMYQKVNGAFNWSSHIGSFVFPSCSGTGGGPAVTLAPASLKWGKIAVGTTSGAKTVTLTNSGSATLNIASITTSGDFAQKIVKTSCGSTVAAGKSCKIQVTFTPTQTGMRTGNLTITDNAPDNPQTVPLSGTGK